MIEVFATNIINIRDARVVEGFMKMQFPKFLVNFDLADIDNILRIESNDRLDPIAVIKYVSNLGFEIKVLE